MKTKLVLLLMLISASSVFGQTYNQVEFGWAYNFTHYNKITTSYLGVSGGLNATNWNGFHANFIYSPMPHFGIEANSSSAWGSGTACATSGSLGGTICTGSGHLGLYQIAVGPRFQFPTHSQITPYAHALVGESFANWGGISGDLRGPTIVPGGGFRIQIARHVALTSEVDYQYARLHDSVISSAPTLTANGIRATAGILITFIQRPAGSQVSFRNPAPPVAPRTINSESNTRTAAPGNDCEGDRSPIAATSAVDCHGRPK